MQKHFLFIALIAILFSCSQQNDLEQTGNWKLIQMSGSFQNSETTGSDMEWQENYLLNANGTFLKTRDREGIITKASGTYTLVADDTEMLLEFIFNEDSDLIGSCSSNLTETMNLQSENTFSSTWQACDGPGLSYEKQ